MAGDIRHTKHQIRLQAAAKSAEQYAAPTYFRFTWQTVKGSTPYALYARLRQAFAPTLWLARAWRIARIAFAVIQASALLLFAVAFVLALLPPALLLLLAIWLAALRERRRLDRCLNRHLFGRPVLVIFGDGRSAAAFTGRYNVFVVPSGFPLRHPAALACRMPSGAICVREYYYFHLRRTVFRHASRVMLLF